MTASPGEYGTDVVAALVETHGRPHAEALLADLEITPPSKVRGRGTRFGEIDLGTVLRAQPPGREPREVASILYSIEGQHENAGRLDTEADEAADARRADPAPESRQALADVLGQLIHALSEHVRLEEQGISPLMKGHAQPDGIPFPSGPLTGAERRVLRYLPTHLSAREIAAQLFCSVNTVKTHQRHVYAKLGANSRTEAVMRARALGMLVPARAPLNGHVTSRSPA